MQDLMTLCSLSTKVLQEHTCGEITIINILPLSADLEIISPLRHQVGAPASMVENFCRQTAAAVEQWHFVVYRHEVLLCLPFLVGSRCQKCAYRPGILIPSRSFSLSSTPPKKAALRILQHMLRDMSHLGMLSCMCVVATMYRSSKPGLS